MIEKKFDLDWKDLMTFDFEKAFSIMRGLKIPMSEIPSLKIEAKIPDTIGELQGHILMCLNQVLDMINTNYSSPVTWQYGPFVYVFEPTAPKALTIYFAPIVVHVNCTTEGKL
jgi:hypothetical protein